MIVMVRAWAHKLSDMSLMGVDGVKVDKYVHWEEAQVSKVYDHPSLGYCFIGSFVCGIGAVDCHFPFNHVRVCTDEERDLIKRTRYGRYNYTDDMFANKHQLYYLPEIKNAIPVTEFVPAIRVCDTTNTCES